MPRVRPGKEAPAAGREPHVPPKLCRGREFREAVCRPPPAARAGRMRGLISVGGEETAADGRSIRRRQGGAKLNLQDGAGVRDVPRRPVKTRRSPLYSPSKTGASDTDHYVLLLVKVWAHEGDGRVPLHERFSAPHKTAAQVGEKAGWLRAVGSSRRSAWLDYGVPVFTDDVRVVELSGLQRPGDLVSTEDDAGRHCFRADELE